MNPTFKNRPNLSHKIGDREIWESRSPAVVGILLASINNSFYVLAEKRSETMPDAPGKWVVPCGYLDWDEEGWDALRREVYEETSFFIDKFAHNIIFDNDRQPIYVMSHPRENRQNIALNYCIVFDFDKRGLPKYVQKYKDEEVEKVKWIPIEEVPEYEWAFEHDGRIFMAINKLKLL